MVVEKIAYSVSEAAKLLGISKSLLYKYIQEGKAEFPVKKIAGRILIPCRALEEYMNNGGGNAD
jgi:excisionase family DNA binding protein